MRLPGGEQAVIDAAKLSDYLLSATHPVGRFKFVCFRSLGYEAQAWVRLERDLRRLATENDARPGQLSPHGRKYEVEGMITGPNGMSARIVTVWILPAGQANPRFVTAYPS